MSVAISTQALNESVDVGAVITPVSMANMQEFLLHKGVVGAKSKSAPASPSSSVGSTEPFLDVKTRELKENVPEIVPGGSAAWSPYG